MFTFAVGFVVGVVVVSQSVWIKAKVASLTEKVVKVFNK